MSGNTMTQSATSSLSRAARELELRRGEFDLALHLGCVRTVPDEGGGGRRVARTEIDRVRSEDGFPESLRERVKVVGTTEGAALMEVTTARFTRLARLGLVVPVKFYLNRYRALVWLYLAEELRQFTADKDNALMLSGRTPEGLRDQLEAGLDLRPRNWRGRHMGFLLRQAEDPWARAAVVASLLDPVQVAEIVSDPYERAYLNRFRPEHAPHGAPDSPAAHLASRIMTAEDPDEIRWLRADLGQALAEARELRAAPRPTAKVPPSVAVSLVASPPVASPPVASRPGPTAPEERPAAEEPLTTEEGPATEDRPTTEDRPRTEDRPTTEESERSRRLLGWLRRRNP
ncbi:DUF6397 family protein [Streptomyces lutosisoli]|uniref:DUF6397 family protein n=1 Tax=Streptomyces lutosisoli TaxID=2665721 RepID=A0ABW2VQY5_9ACTN